MGLVLQILGYCGSGASWHQGGKMFCFRAGCPSSIRGVQGPIGLAREENLQKQGPGLRMANTISKENEKMIKEIMKIYLE